MSLSPFQFPRNAPSPDRGRPSWVTHTVWKIVGGERKRMGWADTAKRAERMAEALGGAEVEVCR